MTQRNSLRWKLTWLIAAGSAFTAILSAAGFTWLDLRRYRQHLDEAIPAIVRQYMGGAALILALSLAIAAGVGAGLQTRVSAPILRIAQFAQHVGVTHSFERRVEVNSADELGVLALSFNMMLEEIQRR